MGKLSDSIPTLGLNLAKYSGAQIIDRLGQDVMRETVASILCGYNVRAITENLTRRRLTLSNGAMLKTFLTAAANNNNFNDNLMNILLEELTAKTSAEKKLFIRWVAGLTEKGVQNILRGNSSELKQYLRQYAKQITETTKTCSKEYGEFVGEIKIDKVSTKIDWLFINYLFAAIGMQTLAIRGLEKSIYGKLFEPLVLSSLLQILGFEISSAEDYSKKEKVFWLSHRKDKRESDATLLYRPGIGIYFDIGFIGPGNPEITLDKVTRFERELEHGRRNYNMTTIIIVDRIGEGSRLMEMASKVGGHVVQMSMAHWVLDVCKILKKKIGFKHKILTLDHQKLENYIRKEIKKYPLLLK